MRWEKATHTMYGHLYKEDVYGNTKKPKMYDKEKIGFSEYERASKAKAIKYLSQEIRPI